MLDAHVYHELGLKDEEFEKICDLLGREPTTTELAMFSVEWSEHCGYPRSRPLLKLLPRQGKYAPAVFGDAGAIEAAPGLLVVFKVESHNHPSQVEPKQGAATGVGGIIRDIFTMGARPIACLNSLHFGELSSPLARYLFNGVVDGIQFYGNCVGVPTVGGEVIFNDCYKGNCLVNVMCVGTVEADRLMLAEARGEGNAVMYVGSSTGRDGIGGCSVLASHEFCEDDQKRPTVQIGDPFTEKCLIEACLEALEAGGIVGLKDMGAAGVTCTTCEMAAAGGVGMDVDLALIPRREEGMEPYEVMMSESQERMLCVVEKGHEDEVAGIFHKWDLNAVVIGRVTSDGVLRIRDQGKVVGEMKAQDLASPPTYQMPAHEPAYLRQVQSHDLSGLKPPEDCGKVLLDLLSAPNIASKEWVYHQYDHMVQTNTSVLPGADAAVLRLKGTERALAVCMDCNPRYCYLDPYLGAQIALAEAARNVVCVGAEPAGITDCLNFGNPEKPDRFWQFREAVRGLVDACREFEVPVVSGNVSFYNETTEDVIFPTPKVGMVGVLEHMDHRTTHAFKQAGDVVLLVGTTRAEFGGTEYLKQVHGLEVGRPPALDMQFEKRVQAFVLEAIRSGWVSSAHDCSDGGLGVALAECCIGGGVGARVAFHPELPAEAWLFSESQSRVLLSAPKDIAPALQELGLKHGVPAHMLGKVQGDRLIVQTIGADKPVLDLSVDEMERTYRSSISCLMG